MKEENKDAKRIRQMERMEIKIVVILVLLCIATIMEMANREWPDSAMCVLWIVIAYAYFRRSKEMRLLMQYIGILEVERTYHESRIEVLEKLCKEYEECVETIIANQGEVIKNHVKIIQNLQRVQNENGGFIPSEGGE